MYFVDMACTYPKYLKLFNHNLISGLMIVWLKLFLTWNHMSCLVLSAHFWLTRDKHQPYACTQLVYILMVLGWIMNVWNLNQFFREGTVNRKLSYWPLGPSQQSTILGLGAGLWLSSIQIDIAPSLINHGFHLIYLLSVYWSCQLSTDTHI